MFRLLHASHDVGGTSSRTHCTNSPKGKYLSIYNLYMYTIVAVVTAMDFLFHSKFSTGIVHFSL